jgi:hypothetical protein
VLPGNLWITGQQLFCSRRCDVGADLGQQPDDRPEGGHCVVLSTRCPGLSTPALSCERRRRLKDGGLADACFTGKEQEPAVPGDGSVQRRAAGSEDLITSDDAGLLHEGFDAHAAVTVELSRISGSACSSFPLAWRKQSS